MEPERRYWDSDCFLGWLRSEQDKASACDGVLKLAEEGKIAIFTSALTLAEVIHAKGHPKLALNRRADVERFFDRTYIEVIPLVRPIAELARDLVWDSGISPKDAVHVASAIKAEISLMNTFDTDLMKRSGLDVGGHRLAIAEPALIQGEFDYGKP